MVLVNVMSWIGDGYCDGVDQAYGADLSCYDNDGGDCDTAGTDGTDGGDDGSDNDALPGVILGNQSTNGSGATYDYANEGQFRITSLDMHRWI